MRKLFGIIAITGGLVLLVFVQTLLQRRAPLAQALAEGGAAPVIAVDPTALESEQPSGSLVTQTLTVHNLGDSDLNWHIYDGTAVGLWDQTDNASSNGAPSQYFPDLSGGGYAADDFVVPAEQSWQISQIFVPGSYTPGAGPAPDFDVTVYADASGMPDAVVASESGVAASSDVNGDITLALASPIVLPTGSYWLSVNANMAFTGPPEQWFWTARTVQTGSPYHWMETGVFSTTASCIGSWQPGAAVCGVGGGVDPDLVFDLQGVYAGCETLPWVTVSPVTGTVAVSGTMPVAVAFDASGYMPGVYTGTLCIASDDPVQSLLSVPVTMTVITPTYGVSVGPDASATNLPGSTANYLVSVMNFGNSADVYTLTVSSTWTTTLSVDSLALAGGASETVTVTVNIPASATNGEVDTAVFTATSHTDPAISDTATLTTTVGTPLPDNFIYLPFVRK
ncbi:MAG: hypothetical protein H6658_21525 [Ardenticatenaceae bacterium]|nr:hypothetical protein [Ardenticatenaceae bacterium]